MTKKLVFSAALSILFLLTACQAVPPKTLSEAATQPSDVAWDDDRLYAQGLIGSEQGVLRDLEGATVYHLDLSVNRNLSHVTGEQQVRYTNREDIPLHEIYFRLYPNVTGGSIDIISLKVAGQAVDPTYELADSAMRVPLPSPLDPGEQVVVELAYEIAVPSEMGGNYGLFGYFNDVLVLDTFYPAVAVYDGGWQVDMPPRTGDLTFYDASLYLVRVSAPKKLTMVASGIEVGRETEGSTQTVTYAAGPARDFYLAGSSKYVKLSETVGQTTVNSYVLKGRQEEGQMALHYAIQALESFGERFGDYPYTELDVLSTPMQALGIEYPGAIGISLRLYDPKDELYGVPAVYHLESVVAHEVGHQWFYNVVGNDQVNEPWVDEAVVQYVTGLYHLDTSGKEAARQYRTSWSNRWSSVETKEIPIGMPVDAYEGAEYGAIVYGRGPIFVAALADEMGQETFDAFLHDYYQMHKWGIGTANAFQHLAEEHCRCDLSPIFAEWVYGP